MKKWKNEKLLLKKKQKISKIEKKNEKFEKKNQKNGRKPLTPIRNCGEVTVSEPRKKRMSLLIQSIWHAAEQYLIISGL